MPAFPTSTRKHTWKRRIYSFSYRPHPSKKTPQHHPSLFLWEKPLAFLSVHCPFQMHNTFIHLQVTICLPSAPASERSWLAIPPVNTTNSIQANITGASAPYKQVGRADARLYSCDPTMRTSTAQCRLLNRSRGKINQNISVVAEGWWYFDFPAGREGWQGLTWRHTDACSSR